MTSRVPKAFQLALFGLFLSLYVLTMKGICTRDNILHYDRTQTIIKKGTLSMPNDRYGLDEQWWLKFMMAPGKDGRVYLTLGDGLSLAAVPLGWVGNLVETAIGAGPYERKLRQINEARRIGVQKAIHDRMRDLRKLPSAFFVTLTNPIAMALTALIFFNFCHALTESIRKAFCGSLLLGAGTTIWAYSSTFWTQPIVTFCLFGAFYCVFLSTKERASKLLVLAGTLVGYAFITRYFSIVALPWIVLYVIRRHREEKRSFLRPLALLLLPVAFFLLLQMWWNSYRFGSLLQSGGWHQGYLSASFSAKMRTSLPALLLGFHRSVFVFSPPLILGLLGMRSFLRTHRLEAEALLAIIVTYFLVYSRFTLWFAPGSWGPRFLVPITTFMLLPACFFVTRQLWKKLLTCGLLLVGIAAQLIGVLLPLQRLAIIQYFGGLPRPNDYFLKSEIVPQAKAVLAGNVELWFLDGPIKGMMGAVLAVAFCASLSYCIVCVRRRPLLPAPESCQSARSHAAHT